MNKKEKPKEKPKEKIDAVEIEVEIFDIGDEGEGIGRSKGMTVFVEGAVPGDVVIGQVSLQKKNFAKARLLRIKRPSKDRVVPPCSVFDLCGGCQIQNLNYKAQLKLKEDLVKNALIRVGQFDSVDVLPIIGMDEPFRYRNKGVYPVQGNPTQPIIGLYKKHSHNVVNVADCLLQDEKHAKIIDVIRKYMVDFKVEPYDVKQHKGDIKYIVIRKSERTGEVMVVIVTAGRKLAMTKTLVGLLCAADSNIVSVLQNIHPTHSMKGLGDESKVLFGKTTITDQIGALQFEISAKSFYQVNVKQTEVLYQTALDYAKLSGTETVYELYSGTGTISLFLAQKAKFVYGIEMVEEAVEDAKQNAARNEISNVSFILGEAESAFESAYEAGHRADVVVVDPPRAGLDPAVIATILKMSPDRVVYVSCKPSTLARDLNLLCADGTYKIEKVQPVDVFGQTSHVETVCLLSK